MMLRQPTTRAMPTGAVTHGIRLGIIPIIPGMTAGRGITILGTTAIGGGMILGTTVLIGEVPITIAAGMVAITIQATITVVVDMPAYRQAVAMAAPTTLEHKASTTVAVLPILQAPSVPRAMATSVAAALHHPIIPVTLLAPVPARPLLAQVGPSIPTHLVISEVLAHRPTSAAAAAPVL